MTGADHGGGEAIDPADLLAVAVDAGEAAAAFLMDGLHRERTHVTTKSSLTDMVTEMDQRSEALIVERVTAARPDDGLLGEEGATRTGTTGVVWVIDPLDGTTNYLYGHPGFSVSIAAVAGGATVAGVVVDPVHGETYTATAGGGSRCNDRQLSGPRPGVLPETLVGTGFAYDAGRRALQGQVVAALLPQIRDLRRGGGAAVDLCLVAQGRLDAYFERGLAPWDLAAGGLIAQEAGATVGGFDGGPAGPDGVLAAHPGLFDVLAERLRAAGAAEA